jgi:hypothetical protein
VLSWSTLPRLLRGSVGRVIPESLDRPTSLLSPCFAPLMRSTPHYAPSLRGVSLISNAKRGAPKDCRLDSPLPACDRRGLKAQPSQGKNRALGALRSKSEIQVIMFSADQNMKLTGDIFWYLLYAPIA